MGKKWIAARLIKNGAVGSEALAAQSVTPVNLANAVGIPPGVIPASSMGVPITLELAVPDAATGNTDFTGLPYKIRVLDVLYLKTGGAGNAGNSIALHNGITGNAITDAMNNATDTGTSEAATLDDAFTTVAAGTTLRCVGTRAGGNNAALITVIAVRVA